MPNFPALSTKNQSANINQVKQFKQKGAMPCVGLVSLSEYLDELKDFEIETCIN